MSWKDPLDAIVAILDGISDVGYTFDYQPDFRETELKDLATSWESETNRPIINAWFVERVAVEDTRGGIGGGVPIAQAERTDRYQITGFYGYAKGGETTYDFQALVESVMDRLLEDVDLTDPDWWTGGLSADLGLQEFGDYLSHSVEITIDVHRRKSPTYR